MANLQLSVRQMPQPNLRANLRIAHIALVAALVGGPAFAEVKLPIPAVDQSAIAKRGFFYVGGHYVGDTGKHIMQGQIYVEVLAPKVQRRPYPLVRSTARRKPQPTGWARPTAARAGRNISLASAISST